MTFTPLAVVEISVKSRSSSFASQIRRLLMDGRSTHTLLATVSLMQLTKSYEGLWDVFLLLYQPLYGIDFRGNTHFRKVLSKTFLRYPASQLHTITQSFSYQYQSLPSLWTLLSLDRINLHYMLRHRPLSSQSLNSTSFDSFDAEGGWIVWVGKVDNVNGDVGWRCSDKGNCVGSLAGIMFAIGLRTICRPEGFPLPAK